MTRVHRTLLEDDIGGNSNISVGDSLTLNNTDPENTIINANLATNSQAIEGESQTLLMTPYTTLQQVRNILQQAGILGVASALRKWKAERLSSRTHYAGADLTGGTGGWGGGTGSGRTFAFDSINHRIRQGGYIRTVSTSLLSAILGDGTNSIKFKVLRRSGSFYTLVSESEFISPANVTTRQTFNLSQPMLCEQGDVLAVWLKGYPAGSGYSLRGQEGLSGGLVRWIEGETLTSTWNESNNYGIDISGQGILPFIISCGDSIAEGHNTSSNWHSIYHTGPAGNINAEPMHLTKVFVPEMEYQNFAQGSTTWADISTKVSAINALGPRAVVAAFGVNDVAAGRTWAQISADINSFRSALSSNTRLFIQEVLPWTAGTDAQAAAIRSLNTNYANWCAANGATLILAHDAMGQVRPSTGQLDDLISSYNQDGVHLTTAGVAELGRLIFLGLDNYLWL